MTASDNGLLLGGTKPSFSLVAKCIFENFIELLLEIEKKWISRECFDTYCLESNSIM